MTPGHTTTQALPVAATRFEDIIDGYFPLQESLRQMLCRHGFASACVTLTHAPIMDIPDLAPDAPVPLRLLSGTAGSASRLDIIVTLEGLEAHLSGAGHWRWYAGDGPQSEQFSPLTRLAEPAIVQGVGLVAGGIQTQTFGKLAVLKNSAFVILQDQGIDLHGLPHGFFWAKSPVFEGIHRAADPRFTGLFETPTHEIECDLDLSEQSKWRSRNFTEILVLKGRGQ